MSWLIYVLFAAVALFSGQDLMTLLLSLIKTK